MSVRCNLSSGCTIALILAVGLGGCGELKQTETQDAGKVRAEAKRKQAACGSRAAYDRVKAFLFDQAISQHSGDRTNLETLSDYSAVRMEQPVVQSWDAELDLTKCKSRLIVMLPPGAERGFAGERQLQADIEYTAQAAADGSGYVYQVKGAEPIVARLTAFNLKSQTFQPPAAIDQAASTPAGVPESAAIAEAEVPSLPRAEPTPLRRADAQRPAARVQPGSGPRDEGDDYGPELRRQPRLVSESDGEATVRSFYNALGAGDGSAASAHIVPEKRSRGAFSSGAMSRFYGKLPEPIRLTGVTPLGSGSYRVTYRYSAGRSRCNGAAVVSLARRDDRDLIRSIRALRGC